MAAVVGRARSCVRGRSCVVMRGSVVGHAWSCVVVRGSARSVVRGHARSCVVGHSWSCVVVRSCRSASFAASTAVTRTNEGTNEHLITP